MAIQQAASTAASEQFAKLIDAIRELLTNANVVGLGAALLATWQAFVEGAPDKAILAGGIYLLSAISDHVLGSRRALGEGRFKLRVAISSTLDKIAARFGVLMVAAFLGLAVDNVWWVVGATVAALTICESLSIIGHVRALRAEAPGETGVLDWLSTQLGALGEAAREIKIPTIPSSPQRDREGRGES